MSLWGALARLFGGGGAAADGGFIVRGGRALTWARADLAIDLILDPSALNYEGELVSGVRAINAAVEAKLYLFPVELAESMRMAWSDPTGRKRIRRTIVVRGDGAYNPVEPHLASTDFEYDIRTGQIFNAEITFPPHDLVVNAFGTAFLNQMCLHELCHGLGLDHDQIPTSIMWPKLRAEATTLLGTDIARLRAAYK